LTIVGEAAIVLALFTESAVAVAWRAARPALWSRGLVVSVTRIVRGVIALVLIASGVRPASAGQMRSADVDRTWLSTPPIQKALTWVQQNEPRLLDDQVRICQVAAPPFAEARRAEFYKRLMEEAGLDSVRIDRVGNVIGERPGASPRPNLVFSAHLDTVFPESTDVRVTRNGTRFTGPGIGDDCRGLAVMLGVIRALNETHLRTDGTVTFVATVGEEGLGDLRGVKHLFATELKGRIDAFVSVDGPGDVITHIGVGSRRYRVTYRGPGGHSYADFGVANPIHALGRAIATISTLTVPDAPRTTFNVGRVGGGTSVNAIPFEAWMEVDLRSSDAAALASLDSVFLKAIDQALADENSRWSQRGRLTMVKALVGERPAGRTSESAPIVQTVVSVTRALGLPIQLGEGSTDSNIPMSLGIPAVTISGGGRGAGAHAPDESFDSTGSWRGTQRALLVTLALIAR
jgi:acetylornithine deacetylase/succinyl-diaminopimelate desuccinylase-like protein